MPIANTCLAKAFTLIVGPILLGAGFFLTTSPAQESGVYAEVEGALYELAPCDVAGPSTLSTNSPSYSGVVQSFFVVFPEPPSVPLPASWAQLFFTVVDHAQPQTDFGRHEIATDIRTMTPSIYRVVASQGLLWRSGGISESVYRQTLARHPGSRATTELLVELEVPHPSGQGPCGYGVSLGPPSYQPESSLGWFVAPPGELR